MKRFLIPVLTAGLALFALAPSISTGQSSDEYQVAVSMSAINLPVFVPGVPNLGAALKTITAKANDQTCTTETIAGATADVVLHIGGASQPAACSLDGAKVTLIDGNGLTLFVSFTLKTGTRDTLSNLAPLPPHQGQRDPRQSELLGTSSAEFQIAVPVSIIQQPSGPPSPEKAGELLGTLAVFANGERCLVGTLANTTTEVVFRLGMSGQPEACSLEGAAVTFTANGEPFGKPLILRKGTRARLERTAGEPADNQFQIVIAASLVNQGGSNSPGARFRTLTGLANGTACTTVDISAVRDDVLLRFGLPGQPEVCGLDGATVTLRIGEGTLLVGSWEIKKGTQVPVVRQFAVRPPVDGPGPSRPGTFTPPDTGDAGLR